MVDTTRMQCIGRSMD